MKKYTKPGTKIMTAVCALLCLLALAGCTDDAPEPDRLEGVEQVGQLPGPFQSILEHDLFRGAAAFGDRLLTTEVCSADAESRTVVQQVRMMDLYGKDLAAYTCTSDDAYHVTTLTATEDGGFLFVLGFSDYAYGPDAWAGDEGFASRVIKCDKDGALQFDTAFDGVEGAALRHCFEENGRFYLFGTLQTPESQTRGVYSPTDIYMVILDANGEILKTACIAGSDYDSLDAAELTDDGFLLSISAQSDDGDFAGSNSNGYPVDWVFTVNGDLELTGRERTSGRAYSDVRIGERDGAPVYRSDGLLDGFDAGTANAFLDYGDFYLIVSSNVTGLYEHTPPWINSAWCYTETVYSAYDENGKLLFRASVDSSPDFDAWVEG